MSLILSFLLFFAPYIVPVSSMLMIRKETMVTRDTLIRQNISQPEHIHEVVIIIKQKNLDLVHDLLMDRATPGRPQYLKWLTDDELHTIVRNDEAVNATLSWLSEHGLQPSSISQKQNTIHVSAPIHVWESMLHTKFYVWKDSHYPDRTKFYNLASDYHLPTHLTDHIAAVFNTCQAPIQPKQKGMLQRVSDEEEAAILARHSESDSTSRILTGCSPSNPCYGQISTLNSFYGVTSNVASASLSQAAFQTNDEGFSQTDVNTYLALQGFPAQTILTYGGESRSDCTLSTCGEGNLDTQILAGIAQQVHSFCCSRVFVHLDNLNIYHIAIVTIYYTSHVFL